MVKNIKIKKIIFNHFFNKFKIENKTYNKYNRHIFKIIKYKDIFLIKLNYFKIYTNNPKFNLTPKN